METRVLLPSVAMVVLIFVLTYVSLELTEKRKQLLVSVTMLIPSFPLFPAAFFFFACSFKEVLSLGPASVASQVKITVLRYKVKLC